MPLLTPGPRAVTISGIAPASVTNAVAAKLTVTGSGFTPGMSITIGGQALEQIVVASATQLTATLPAGLCPGVYSATLTDSQGEQISGGRLTLQGLRAATLGAAPAAAPVRLNGRDQQITIPLPVVQIEDTTCDGADWQLSIALSPLRTASGRGSLPQRSLALADSEATPRRASLTHRGEQAEATIQLSRAGRTRATLSPQLEAVVPASAAAGQYSMSVSITLVAAP